MYNNELQVNNTVFTRVYLWGELLCNFYYFHCVECCSKMQQCTTMPNKLKKEKQIIYVAGSKCICDSNFVVVQSWMKKKNMVNISDDLTLCSVDAMSRRMPMSSVIQIVLIVSVRSMIHTPLTMSSDENRFTAKKTLSYNHVVLEKIC